MHERLETRLLDSLPPVYRRVRRAVAERLTARLAARRDRTSDDSIFGSLHRVLRDLARESAACDAGADELVRRYTTAPSEEARRSVLIEHLRETVANPLDRRGDLRALKRWLDVDALRERLVRRRHALQIEEELALRCLVGVVPADGTLPVTPALTELLPTLLQLSLRSTRLQNQLAALEALGALLRATPMSPSAPRAITGLEELLGRPELDPQLEAEAFRALASIDPEQALTRLRKRFRPPYRSKWDLLFRRHAVERIGSVLPRAHALEWLAEVASTDPSEYVRMGVCERAASASDGKPLLLSLAGVLGTEQSPRVRGAALIALLESPWLSLDGTITALADFLREETEELLQRVACELVLRACARPGWTDGGLPSGSDRALIRVLDALIAREDVTAALSELASSAALALRCVVDPRRRVWLEHLRGAIARTPMGQSTRIRLDRLPLELTPVPEDPGWFGEMAAAISDRAHGVYLERHGNTLTVWRGDRFRRRLWRTLHELRHPAPNKRQAFFHTLGRTVPGTVRAHPGHLEEVTTTQVPGERVLVASQGNWGRHLPMVDDVLDLPLGGSRPVRIFSSHGETLIQPPSSFARRLGNRLRITRSYAHLAALRLDALHGREAHERRRYADALERDLGITLSFAPYQKRARVPAHVTSLFPTKSSGALAGAFAFDGELATALSDRLVDQQGYFLDANGNGVLALGLFTAGLFTVFLGDSYRKRQIVRTARDRIPLCIGGWGTRGKSGTERLKAALFAGLGFHVLAKTTGSEAMFVQSGGGSPATEFFIFRPYDKATIWEQKDILELASKLDVEVFLWECMALQPQFVELLQNDWMRDDLSTLTNAYPDHEDIQGPAGHDVASVITQFMAKRGTVITTEDQFLPLFEEVANERETRLLHSPWWEAELIPEEVLALFPYREHPRNVALVAKLAEQLGISRTVAIGYMAEHVQPEIGVLKAFPAARVRGRRLTFINGHSANERTGFLNNWRRSGLDAIDPERSDDRAIVTVINNRWDRVARSQVFARILVEDASADRHVLIGTNLEGLQKYVRESLVESLERAILVTEADLEGERDDASWAPLQRLQRQLAHLRLPLPTPANFFSRFERYARGAKLTTHVTPELRTRVETVLEGNDGAASFGPLRAKLALELGPLFEAAVAPREDEAASELPEVLTPASFHEVRDHAIDLLAKLCLHARLRQAASRIEKTSELDAFHRSFRESYTDLFLSQIVVVHDAHATGDQIIDACARAIPPGLEVSVMGAQNIKGTGLDWVYRWVALDKVQGALEAIGSASPDVRRQAMELLEGFEDHGLVDAGLARARLPELAERAASVQEAERLRRLATRAADRHAASVAALAHTIEVGVLERIAKVMESGFDYLDSVKRRRSSELILGDLVAGRISRPRAALEMRRLYERQKGGWLVGKLRSLREAPKPELEAPMQTVPEIAAAAEALFRNTAADEKTGSGRAAREPNRPTTERPPDERLDA